VTSILLDTGALVALHQPRDVYRDAVRAALREYRQLLTTWPVVTEACHLTSAEGALRLLNWIDAGGLDVFELGEEGRRKAITLFRRYRNVPMDLADASILAAAELTGVRDVASVDFSEFETYRTGKGRPLRNVLSRLD
jgi:uncharacterized protein